MQDLSARSSDQPGGELRRSRCEINYIILRKQAPSELNWSSKIELVSIDDIMARSYNRINNQLSSWEEATEVKLLQKHK